MNDKLNVIICGVIKNSGNFLKNSIHLCEKLGKECNKYKIVIYENNSTDSTKDILRTYENNEHFTIIMEDIDNTIIKENSKIWAYTEITGSDHPCRIEQISNARNKLIDEINKDIYDDYNLVVMIDLDTNLFDNKGILHSLNIVKESPKKVLYGNSFNYYDYYALRSSHSIFSLLGPEINGEFFWKNQINNNMFLSLDYKSDNLFSVYSAFNGIGVFHKNIFKNRIYDCLVNDSIKKTYNKIFIDHPNLYDTFKNIIENDCPKYINGHKDNISNIYWKNNSGYNKPVICEHVSFNFSLINDGYEIYINPKMLYWKGD